jgi:hypothetical protein
MSDDLHRDAVDDELSRRFGASAAPGADPDVALDALRPRLQRARTRRRASIASAVAGTAMVLVLLVVALSGGGGTNSVHTPPASHAPIQTLPPAPTTTDSGRAATDDTIVSGTNGGGNLNRSDDGSTEATEPNGSGETATTSPTSAPVEDVTYTSDGGSIVVHFADGAVSLVSSSPAAGYTAEVHDNGPTRVEVRFSNGTIEWRIRVDVVNGGLQPEITQH